MQDPTGWTHDAHYEHQPLDAWLRARREMDEDEEYFLPPSDHDVDLITAYVQSPQPDAAATAQRLISLANEPRPLALLYAQNHGQPPNRADHAIDYVIDVAEAYPQHHAALCTLVAAVRTLPDDALDASPTQLAELPTHPATSYTPYAALLRWEQLDAKLVEIADSKISGLDPASLALQAFMASLAARCAAPMRWRVHCVMAASLDAPRAGMPDWRATPSYDRNIQIASYWLVRAARPIHAWCAAGEKELSAARWRAWRARLRELLAKNEAEAAPRTEPLFEYLDGVSVACMRVALARMREVDGEEEDGEAGRTDSLASGA